jgi:pyruvate formate-lyase/glycerol dehydratase family glycyl radical enzyme
MSPTLSAEYLKKKITKKAVRNIRQGGQKEDAERGMYRPEIKLDLQRSVLLTESYKETDGQPMVIRRAKALENILSRMDLYIQDHERIVGNNVSTPHGLFFGIDMAWRSVRRIVNEEEGRTLLDDEGRKTLDELITYWDGKSMSDIQQRTMTGKVLGSWKLDRSGAATWSHWSELGIPDYEKVFRVGLRGLINEAQDRLAEIDRTVPPDYVDQKEFLQAVVIALEAVITFAHRYRDMAREKLAQASDPEQRARLEKIAEICGRVPEFPPRTLHEVLQSFFLLHVVRYLEYSTLGIGVRFDKVFGPYYENDIKNGTITREEALELLQLLWVKFHELGLIYSPTLSSIYGGVASLQAITLGGVDDEGNDVTNEMTYLVLECAGIMRSPEPTIVMRYHDGTPRELLSKTVDVIRTGIGYPSFFNDKAILPLLEKWDVPEKDANDYAVTGCVYLEIPGKNVSRKAYGGLVLPLALWYALNQGKSQWVQDMQVGAQTPDPLTFESFDDLMDAYLKQVEFFAKRLCTLENTCQSLYEKYLPRPFYSALLEGCIEQGKDCRKFDYPSPVSHMCIIIGPTNVADAITAIKKNVFEDKKISMKTLLEAMAANWEGYEQVRQLMVHAPKYGNDSDYADAVAAEVHHRTAEAMAKAKTRFGYPCRGDGSGISATYAAGAAVPATAEGRFAGTALCDSTLAPVFGMDRNGPTAVLKSASKISTVKTYNHLLNQKFLPEALDGAMKEKFIDYIRAWGDLGISQIQFNVVDRETLLDAQRNPEKYQDLLVRVAGYSAYFVDLSKGLQDSIIARTSQCF